MKKIMQNKKGVEMSMNVIIIAAIAILIMVILIMFVFNTGTSIDQSKDCVSSFQGQCTSDTMCGGDYPVPYPAGTCPTEGDHCCVALGRAG